MARIELCALALSLSLLCACESRQFLGDDLSIAREAYLKGDWASSERHLERFLREERDSGGRWEAWKLLLKAINARGREPRASLECLEAMRVEYDGDEPRLALILRRMGENYELLRRHDKAAEAWGAYADLGSLSAGERVEGARRLAAMKLAQRNFDAGEEVLQQCLALPLPDQAKIGCMLDLAEINATRERWREAADLCQQIQDSGPDRRTRGLAGYLLADSLERLGDREGALRQFRLDRDNYPNPAVMDNRIEYLKKRLKSEKR